MNRTQNFRRESLINYGCKLFLIGSNFFTIPITLSWLLKEKYGIWITILSVISWANLSDFGIGNGLRNRISYLLAKKKYEEIKNVTTTSYIILSIISGIIFLIGVSIIKNVNFNKLLNTSLKNLEIKMSFLIVLFNFCLNFILGLSRSIANGKQKSSLVSISQILYSILTVSLLIIGKFYFKGSLISISFIYLFSTTCSNLFLTFLIFKETYYRPNLRNIKFNTIKYTLDKGILFFLIQSFGIIIFSTDNIIINNILGSSKVTEYSLIDKVFSTLNNLFSILLIALWSAVSDAYIKKDFIWIINSIKKLQKYLILFSFVTVFVGIIINPLISFWIREKVIYSPLTIIIFLLYTILMAWNGIYINVINGIGILKGQLILTGIGAIINIPFSIYLGKYCGLGIMGVKLATIFSILLITFILPLQLKIILNKELKENYSAIQ